MSRLNFLYRVIKRLIALDMTHILVLNTDDVFLFPSVEGCSCRMLNTKDITLLSHVAEFSIDQQFIKDFKFSNISGIGGYVDGKLAGICFFTTGNVDARHNSGGRAFRGIALRLPVGTQYLFKVYVRPEYRGRHLTGEMVNHAINEFSPGAVKAIVTTTDIENHAFSNSVNKIGFLRVAGAAEAALFGRHLFRLPPLINPLTGELIKDADGSIEFVEPETRSKVIQSAENQ